MNGLFREDNKALEMLETVAWWFLLSALYLVCCIPLFTIGPATAALYYCTVKSIRKKRGRPLNEFFYGFRQNFKKGALLSILYLTYLTMLLGGLYFSRNLDKDSIVAALYPYIALAFLLPAALTTPYVFAVLSRFECDVWGCIRLSLYLSLRRLPWTLLLAALLAMGVWLCAWNLLFGFLVPAMLCYVFSFPIEAAFKKLSSEDEKATNQKHWSLDEHPERVPEDE